VSAPSSRIDEVGGNTGNVIARFDGTLPDAEPLLVAAHFHARSRRQRDPREGSRPRGPRRHGAGEGAECDPDRREAVAGMKLGRIDEETTANLGVVSGGAAINIVPKLVGVPGRGK
jgi:hypothetical protein